MNTKLNLFLVAAAVIGFASCEKYVPATGNAANGDNAEYVIVIDGAEGTKADASRSLDFADLTGNRTGTFTATLQKRNRETGYMENVSFQPDWSWSKDSEAFSGSQDTWENNKYGFAAKAVGSGKVNVSASYGGNALASSCAEVTVADSRAITWSGATTTAASGITYSATLNCNFAGPVTVSSDNGSFVVGTDASSLGATTSTDFDSSTGTTKTIYYKYTGSTGTTVNLTASNAARESSCNISVGPPVVTAISYTPPFSSYDSGKTLTISNVTATWSDGTVDTAYTNFIVSIQKNVKATSTVSGKRVTFETKSTTGGSTTVKITSNDNSSAIAAFTVQVNYKGV